jgi:hypothetical protein
MGGRKMNDKTFDLDKILAEAKEKVAKKYRFHSWTEFTQSSYYKLDLCDEAALLAIASVREECGKLLNQQGIVMQRKIKELEEQVEAQRKLIDSNDRMYQSSLEAHIRKSDRIRSIESENEQLKKENERLKEKEIRGDSNE